LTAIHKKSKGSSQAPDLEVTYNVTGSLCHILSEGHDFWAREKLHPGLHAELLSKIESTVMSWKLTTERWINYRSLRPLIGLLEQTSLEPQIHLWSVDDTPPL